ncbi:DUF3179 domain-containing protein [Sediminicola luteus]|uniref:DUF3179 domain-containing protein n=1 Tax=Sediminicola luteus TaxID=319238 RepID=A0ABV2TX98_9FLAO
MKNTITLFLILSLLGFPFCEVSAQLKNPQNIPYTWKTDTTKRNIELSEITVAVPRQTFPTIDYPNFIGKAEGLDRFYEHEPVISVTINGESKAYPLNMLTMHEISNDSLGGIPILPTFCPLCNSSVVYDRRLGHGGQQYVLEFEVSGMLRNSDMIMADKQTQTWWQQLTGIGLVGDLKGVELDVIPSMVLSVKDYFKRYPSGKILSPKTGTAAEERYGTNPYTNYDSLGNKPWASFFDQDKLDNRLPPMERVIDLEGKNSYKIYPFSIIAKMGVINDRFDDRNIVIFHKKGTISVLDKYEISKSKAIGSATMFSSIVDGRTLTFKKVDDDFIDIETGSVWDITGRCIQGSMKGKELVPERYSNHFAFAWLAFHPESEIYGEKQ